MARGTRRVPIRQKAIIAIILLLAASSMVISVVSTPFPTPKTNPTPGERDDGIEINVSSYLPNINRELHWGLSDEEIGRHSEKLQNYLEKNYPIENNWVHINNFSRFSEDLRDTIGISEEQRIALLYDHQKEEGYRMAYHHNLEFQSPETPHFMIRGRVTDSKGQPVPGALVRFESSLAVWFDPDGRVIPENFVNRAIESDLVADTIPLSSTTLTDANGMYRINVLWGSQQNASVTKEGYRDAITPGITLTDEITSVDFQLVPKKAALSPGFLVFPTLAAVILVWLIVVKNEHEIS